MPLGFGLLGALLGVIAGAVVVLARSAQFEVGVHMSGRSIAVYVGIGAAVGFVGGIIVGAELLGLLTKKPPAEPSSVEPAPSHPDAP
jgi:hypothetical protein